MCYGQEIEWLVAVSHVRAHKESKTCSFYCFVGEYVGRLKLILTNKEKNVIQIRKWTQSNQNRFSKIKSKK